jgi:cysteinyl-tRNA synthetase
MSKSLGNFLTLKTACPTPSDVRAYRYLVVSSHYRNPLAFTTQAMQAAKNAIKRMDKVKDQLDKALEGFQGKDTDDDLGARPALDSFEAAIRDDLGMPRAAAALFSLIKAAEGEFKRVAASDDSSLNLPGLHQIRQAMEQMDQIFGIFYKVPTEDGDDEPDTSIPTQVSELVTERNAAKEAKDWELADSLRSRITDLGFVVKDVKGGEPIITRVEQ